MTVFDLYFVLATAVNLVKNFVFLSPCNVYIYTQVIVALCICIIS